MENRICVVCGNSFKAKTIRAKYCSEHCKNRSRYPQSRDELNNKTLERHAKIVQLYDSEYSVAEIAEMFDCSVTVVYSAWKKAGLPKRMTKLQNDVKTLREKGMCCTEIAESLNKGPSNIRRICDDIGLPFTDEEKARSIELGKAKAVRIQHGDEAIRRQRQIDFISEHHPQWEYVSGYIASDDNVELRCKVCGTIAEKSAITVRHVDRRLVCHVCDEQRKQEREKEKLARLEAEKQARKQKRAEAFWGQKFQQLNMQAHRCKECGVYYFGGRAGYCSEECRRKQANRKHDKRIDRAKRIDKSISLKKLYKRDKGICWLCGGKCDYKDYSKDENGHFIVGANYPSIDHVYPLSKGGDHVWSNVRLAHHYCNTIKSNKVVAYG